MLLVVAAAWERGNGRWGVMEGRCETAGRCGMWCTCTTTPCPKQTPAVSLSPPTACPRPCCSPPLPYLYRPTPDSSLTHQT